MTDLDDPDTFLGGLFVSSRLQNGNTIDWPPNLGDQMSITAFENWPITNARVNPDGLGLNGVYHSLLFRVSNGFSVLELSNVRKIPLLSCNPCTTSFDFQFWFVFILAFTADHLSRTTLARYLLREFSRLQVFTFSFHKPPSNAWTAYWYPNSVSVRFTHLIPQGVKHAYLSKCRVYVGRGRTSPHASRGKYYPNNPNPWDNNNWR